MKVLVTGGEGFIGSHVIDAYARTGAEVVIVDNFATGRRENVHPKARIYELDLRDPNLDDIIARERPEVVNHHAAQASVVVSVRDPRLDSEVNILGSLNLFLASVKHGVRRIVFASTGGAIYGNPEVLPVDESHREGPLAPYGISKLTAEHHLKFLGSQGVEWAILRYSNVYGPRQDPEGEAGVVAIFTQAMLEKRTPTIFGDGTQTRDFVYVEDVAQANILATSAPSSNVANISVGVETSINDLYRRLAELTGMREQPIFAAPRPGDVAHIALNSGRARRWLGWTPQTDLKEGLRRTVEWFRTRA
jgi:UDP-glucose 4-epimerase